MIIMRNAQMCCDSLDYISIIISTDLNKGQEWVGDELSANNSHKD